MANDSPPSVHTSGASSVGPEQPTSQSLPRIRLNRDRHGRGLRGPALLTNQFESSSRRGQFNELVLAAIGEFEKRLPAELSKISFAVEDVPTPRDLALRAQEKLLGRIEPGDPATCVVYRLPIMMQATLSDDAEILVRHVLATLISELTGLRPETICPDFGD